MFSFFSHVLAIGGQLSKVPGSDFGCGTVCTVPGKTVRVEDKKKKRVISRRLRQTPRSTSTKRKPEMDIEFGGQRAMLSRFISG